jgi:hypothetical protein
MTHVRSMNVSEHILAILNERPGLSDRELTDRIKSAAAHPSQVNQECRLLESRRQIDTVAASGRADWKLSCRCHADAR